MKFSTVFNLAVAGLAGTAVAAKCKKNTGKCLKKADVDELSNAYADLIDSFTVEAADRYLTEDWVDISQAINTFRNLNPGSTDQVTFTKESFVAAQQRPAGTTPIEIISVPVIDCTTFALIWSSTFSFDETREARSVRGITVVSTVKEDDLWKMTQWDVEFNSLGWNYNLGGSYCLPVPPSPVIEGDATCGAAASKSRF